MKLYRSALCALALLAAVSCGKEFQGSGKTGTISFAVSSDESVFESTRSSVSDYTTLPAAGDFTIAISGTDYSWTGKVSEWDAATQLAVGNYSVTANYGASDDEGFDKPWFTGSKDFAVTGGETTAVSIPVALANTIVRVTCTEMFQNYFPTYEFKLSRDNADIVTFAKGETRAAFVDGYKFTLSGTLNGEIKTQTFSQEYTNLDEKTCYTFTFDATNIGGATLTVTFNDTVTTVDLGESELND